MIVGCFITKLLNAQIFVLMNHFTRFFIGGCLSVSSVILFFFGIIHHELGMVLMGSFFTGVSYSITFLSIIGFLKNFPPSYCSFFLSGLGFSGAFTSSLYMWLISHGFVFSDFILFTIPLVVFLFLLFVVLVSQKSKFEKFRNYQVQDFNDSLNINNINLIVTICGGIMLNILIETFCEITSISTFAAHINHKSIHESFMSKHYFDTFIMSYEFSMFLSKISLNIYKIKRLYLLTGMQILLFCIWLYVSYTNYFNLAVNFFLSACVGITSGSLLVNAVYQILNNPNLEQKYKELGLSVMYVFYDLGMMISTIFGVSYLEYIKQT